LALRAAGRYVEILRESVPDLQWLADPIDVQGNLPTPPTITLNEADVERLLGVSLAMSDIEEILTGLDFTVVEHGASLQVTAPSRRLDVREGALGRADVIEEVARLYGYGRLARRNPAWSEPGGLTPRQHQRRHVRDVVVDAGALEAWTPTLVSDAEFDLLHAGVARVRIANPLSAEESVLRATMITGLTRAWARNVERGVGDVLLCEFGVVFQHPSLVDSPRRTRGGAGGTLTLELPSENERLSVVLGRPGDDARTAVALWEMMRGRLGLEDVVVRTTSEAPRGLHPTRSAALVDRGSGSILGYVGEVDPELVRAATNAAPTRRLGLLDLDLDAILDPDRATPVSPVVHLPSRYPSAAVDLAFVTPRAVNAADLAASLRATSGLVESVRLFDVYEGVGLPEGTRSLAFHLRLSAEDRTLGDDEITEVRAALLEAAAALGAVLR
jgi:phenylalanyl-tRNA synthetase beta chain